MVLGKEDSIDCRIMSLYQTELICFLDPALNEKVACVLVFELWMCVMEIED